MPDYRAALGRGSDSMMGHLTPGEAVIPPGSMTPKLWEAFQEALDRQGMAPEQYVVGSGQNSINPLTGQPEFLSQSQRDSYRDYGESRNRAEGRSTGGTGREGRERVSSKVGAIHASPATASLRETGDLYQGPEGAARNLGATTGPREQGGTVDPNNLPNLTYDPNSGLFGEVGSFDLGPLTELLPGPLRAGLDLFDVNTTVPTFDPFGMTGTGGPNYSAMRSSLGRESSREQGLSGQRAAVQQSFMRPEVLPTPQFLGLSSAMTPLQQRSAVASRAIAGQDGAYTSPEAQTFYDNLLQRSLIGDDNSLLGLDTLLPIDLQYLAQIRGIENPADTSALLSALAG